MNKGFATISRSWKPGDQVTLTLPMAVKFNKANELVEADRNRMAITRGPLVYCAEGVDNSGSVQRFFFEEIPASANISVSPMEEGLMKNIEKISMPAMVTDNGEAHEANLILIPYYAWNNRGDASMIVWFPVQE
jgi:hypothetical protein